ncbi:hypothetical protein BDQ94DRAFT_165307 [Aspergillus welwitschiae]|uniref:RING-type domain-containing protein n=1 Tax=Aspergillus welwitschiae TaxID=1341132 RepID=A0A3F3QKS7_9EURO|nr:hypothetical protein BDQ94DRAFT_165307 [Aspergillus welwitschiae]RDH39610.1 hypothetical protein BDQ94DRAFT_165307 [Aspergillus welwitschiae]
MVQVSSLALVGYLAPVLVTFLLFVTWLILGARRRRRRHRRYGPQHPYTDAEMVAPGGHTRIVISQQLIEELYPQLRYKDWFKENHSQQQQQQHLSSGAISRARSTSGNHSGESPDKSNINTSQDRDKDTDDIDTDTDRDNHRTCAICMDEFADDDEIRSLPCRHIFHMEELALEKRIAEGECQDGFGTGGGSY